MADAMLYTIGHSTRTLEELIALLQDVHVALLADIRTIPRSRYNPQFNREALAAQLPEKGIEYRHMPGLGGLRKSIGDASPNTAWRNASFRGFADYMLTSEFEVALAELIALARERTVTVMCAEAVPWHCHRSLVADALTVRGVAVGHIVGHGRVEPHRITPFARPDGTRILYPDAFALARQGEGSR